MGFILLGDTSVTLYVRRDLVCPEISSGCWKTRPWTPDVPMPKAAVNENQRSVPRKNNIRSTRKAFIILPKAESLMKEELPDDQLGLGIVPTNTSHLLRLAQSSRHSKHTL